MRIINDIKLDFDSVLILPKRSTLRSRSEVNLTRSFKFKHSGDTWFGTPLVAANMDGVGTFEMAKLFYNYSMDVALHKHYSFEDLLLFFQRPTETGAPAYPLHTWYSMGVIEKDLIKWKAVRDAGTCIPFVCIDVANGYSEGFVDFVKRFRDDNPEVTIMAGNVVTGDMTEELILSGADIVKVGIGPGSTCITRKQTGVGYPQLSAVIECADAAHGLGGLICSDGGCRVPGDIAKAFGGGADFVMLGGMLAGHLEGGGDRIIEGNKEYIEFYGMSSTTAQVKHNGGIAEYRASEGKKVRIPYRGGAEYTIKEILGGLRSACTYVGAKRLKELSKRTTFVQVSQQRNTVFDKYDT